MIIYHAQYTPWYKIITITYYIFIERLIFLARCFHSYYNCLINHNILILYKKGYKNPESEFRFFLLL